MIQWKTQLGNLIDNHKVNTNFYLPELSKTNILTWDCHVDDSAEIRCDVIMGIDLLTAIELH